MKIKDKNFYCILRRLNNLEKCTLKKLYEIIYHYNQSHFLYFKEKKEKDPRILLSYIKEYYMIEKYEIVNYNSIFYKYLNNGEIKMSNNLLFDNIKKKFRYENMKIYNHNIILQGKRNHMEDNLLIINQQKYFISLVLDGHGGKECSEYLKKKFYDIFLEKQKIYNGYSNIIYHTIKTLNNNFLKYSFNSGSTFNLLFIDKIRKEYYVFNIGDSRCIIYTKNGIIKQISKDHRLNEKKEKDNIYLMGGFILNNRVNGRLSLSRSMGDKNLSKIISSKPDLYFDKIDNIKYFLQGTDGVFDFITNKKLIKYINKKSIQYKKSYIFMRKLGKYIIEKSNDNITCSISYIN